MALSATQLAEINRGLAADPEWARLVQAYSRVGDVRGTSPEAQAILAYYKAHDIPVAQGSNLELVNGQLVQNHPGRDFAKTAIISGLIGVGGAYALGAAGGVGGAAAGSSAATTSGGVGIGETGAVTGLGGSGFGVGAGGGMTAAGIFKGLRTAADYITPIVTTAINNRAAGQAADKQLEAAQKALDLQREMFDKQAQLDELNRKQTLAQANLETTLNQERYNTTRSDRAPYRGIGANAIGTLNGLLGFTAPQAETPAPVRTVPYEPGPTLNTVSGVPAAAGPVSAPQTPDAVAMQTPDGRIVQVPAAQVADASARGAQRVA